MKAPAVAGAKAPGEDARQVDPAGAAMKAPAVAGAKIPSPTVPGPLVTAAMKAPAVAGAKVVVKLTSVTNEPAWPQ